MKGLLGLVLILATAWAQQAIAPPKVGFLVDSRANAYSVEGVAGNFVVGRPAGIGIISSAFSGAFRLLKTDSAVSVVNRMGRIVARTNAPSGPALFAFSSDGSPALAYFPQSKALDLWDGREFKHGPEFNQDVVAIRSISGTAGEFAVQRDGELWLLQLDLRSGSIVSQKALPGIAPPLWMLGDGTLIYVNSRGLVLRRADESEKQIRAHLPGTLAFSQMGSEWVQVTDLETGRLFALNVQPGHEGYYLLPEVRP